MPAISLRTCFLFSMLALTLFVGGATARAADEPAASKRPNILLIYTDDHSHRSVSCYPEAWDFVKTPNIDRLAKRGVRFAHAFIGTWCMPSRATMLTGHHQHGVNSMRMVGQYPGSTYDPAEAPFWPKVFRSEGYNTAHVGKWHTGTDTGAGRDWDWQALRKTPAIRFGHGPKSTHGHHGHPHRCSPFPDSPCGASPEILR